jgi:hypothetical protein
MEASLFDFVSPVNASLSLCGGLLLPAPLLLFQVVFDVEIRVPLTFHRVVTVPPADQTEERDDGEDDRDPPETFRGGRQQSETHGTDSKDGTGGRKSHEGGLGGLLLRRRVVVQSEVGRQCEVGVGVGDGLVRVQAEPASEG